MKKVLLNFLLSLITAFSLVGQAAAQPAQVKQSGEPEDEAVNVKAIRLSYDRENNMMIARGNVELTQGGRILNTDYLQVNLATNDAYAKGRVVLNQGGDLLACSELKMNLDERRGQVQNAKVFIKKQNFHISGKEFKSLGQNNYQIFNGEITTCDGENPTWRIDAKKIDVTLEGYAKIQGGTFRVKGVPVMYFPYFLVPVKTERQSGFLFPEFGTSSKKGFEFNNSFFWAQAPNKDATFYLDAATKKGPGEGLEYRLVTGSNSWAKFYGYHAYELHNYFDDAYSDSEDRSQNRGMTHAEGEHYFSPDFYVKGFL
jgi:LPS-assembly protein